MEVILKRSLKLFMSPGRTGGLVTLKHPTKCSAGKSPASALTGNSKGAQRPRAFPSSSRGRRSSAEPYNVREAAVDCRRAGQGYKSVNFRPHSDKEQYFVRRPFSGAFRSPPNPFGMQTYTKCGNGPNQRERASNAPQLKECKYPTLHHEIQTK